MTCPGCKLAESDPLTVIKYMGCTECDARALATDDRFFEAVEAAAITTPYRKVLQAVFGAGWKEGHELVRQWAERIAKAKQQPGNP